MTPPPSDWLDQGQNATIFFSVAFVGLLVFLFGQPIQHTKTRSTQRNAKRKQKTKFAGRKQVSPAKPKKEKPKKAKVAPPKKWATMHKPDPAEIMRVEEMFRRGRG